MITARLLGLATWLSVSFAGSPTAHSLPEFEDELRDREAYAQPIDREAPGFTLQDADGHRVSLDDFRGKAVVLHFVYASCADVCPLHAERIAEIQAMVNRTPMREMVQFVTITTDPARDTPEILRGYGPAHGLDPVNWVFLTSGAGRPAATRALAERFGHSFTDAEDGSQVHGVVTHVIDREGRWRANFHGLKFEPTNLVLHLNALINDHHGAGTGAVVSNPVHAEVGAPRSAARLPMILAGLGLVSLAVGAVPLYWALRARAR